MPTYRAPHALLVLSLLISLAAYAHSSTKYSGLPSSPTSRDGDRIVVGAPWMNHYAGTVRIVEKRNGTWTVAQTILAPSATPFGRFGSSVALDGEVLAVGAPWEDLFRGAVYVFVRSGGEWRFQQALTIADAASDTRFGSGVAWRDGALVVDGNAATYRFERGEVEWRRVATTTEQRRTDGARELDEETALALTVAGVEDMPATYLAPEDTLEWVRASDGVYEDRVEIKWSPLDLSTIIYKVFRDGTLIAAISSDDSLYNDTTGDRGVTYDYCVVVQDLLGGEADPKCDTGSRIIRPPAHFEASDGAYVDGVHLTWEDRSAVESGYRVRRDGEVVATLARNARSYIDADAILMTIYDYEVEAFDSDGNVSTAPTDDGYRGTVLPALDVSATDGEFANGVRITWVDQGGGAGFMLLRTNVVTMVGALLDTVDVGVEEFFDATAQAGERYEYCVLVLDGFGTLSIPACDEGGVDLVAPLNVAASDSTYDDRVQVTWEDTSGLADGYHIWRDGAVVDTVGSTVRTYNDFDATADVTHTYCVTTFTGNGGESAQVCDDGFRMIVLAPSEVTASDGKFENRTEINWTSKSTTAALFQITRDGVVIKTVGSGARSYADEGGTAGQEYTYGVQAITGVLDASTVSSDPGRRELREPVNVAATDDEYEDRVEISWRDLSSMESGFVIYRTPEGNSVADSIGESGPNTTSFVDRTGAPGVTYSYQIAAFDIEGLARGESPLSDGDDGIRTLERPTAVSATDGSYEDRVEITWADHSNAEDGYRIYRNGIPISFTGDNVTSFTDTSPSFGDVAEYSVRAFDLYGTSTADSDSGSTTVLAPGSLNASDGYTDRVVLRWVDVSEIEDGYAITIDSLGTTVLADTLAAGATSYTDLRAVAGVTYDYGVYAFAGAAVSTTAHDRGLIPGAGANVPTSALTAVLARVPKAAGRLPAADPQDDQFGWSMDIDGATLIVGSPGDNPRGTNSGAAYSFELTESGTWEQVDNFWAAQDGKGGDRLGESVTIDGDRAIIGMPYRNSQYGSFGNYSGLALFFARQPDGQWFENGGVLWPMDEGNNDYMDGEDRFGSSVSLDGDQWVVGAPGDDAGNPPNKIDDLGTIYFYHQGTGTPVKFFSSDAETGDRMGTSVSVLGEWAVAGAPGGDDDGSESGAAYVFHRLAPKQWEESAKLTASDASAGSAFGTAVLRYGNYVIVGAPHNVGVDDGPGAVYVYAYDMETGTWDEEAILSGAIGGTDGFGASLAMTASRLIVAAPGEGAGAFYVFLRQEGGKWSSPSRFAPTAAVAGDGFGSAVAIGDEWAFAGAPFQDVDPDANAGAVYPLLMVGSVTDVVASDGTFNDRVHIEWTDRSVNEEGHVIFRDGVEYDRVGPNEYFYDDIDAEPGRTYEYAVEAVNHLAIFQSERVPDFGWRPPNGTISGRITARNGDGVGGVTVCLEPPPTRALLFDGDGGHVEVPDDSTFDFTADRDFSIEAWFSYAGSDRTPRILSKIGGTGKRPIDLGLQRTGRLFFTMSDGTSVARVMSQRNDLGDDRWHHVAVVHDGGARTLTLYIDGVAEDDVSTAALGDITNNEDIFLGGYGADSWYGGQLDELRIWDDARGAAQIQAQRFDPLTGEEEGLLGYWPFDAVQGRSITDFAGDAQYGSFVGGVYRTEQVAPMQFCGTTDGDGSFVLQNVRYEENGTDFKLRPTLDNRQFSPAVQPITLNRDNPVENQVVFSDISSHDLSGVVRFAGTDCFEPDAEIRVDGAVAAASDKNGKFSMIVTQGEHTIGARLRDYDFHVVVDGDTVKADSVTIDVQEDMDDIVFLNLTRYPVAGKVGGGCDRYVGDVTVRFRSENNCLDTTFVGNPEYTLELPPMRYFASATVDRETIPAALVRPDVISFFQNLGEREVNLVADTDSTVIDDTLDFVYRAPLEITVTGFESYVDPDCRLELEDGTLLPPSLPVIPQGTFVDLTISVAEKYGSETCPLDTGMVVVIDEIFDQENHPDTLFVSDGVATYRTFASTPNLVRGRTEGLNDRSFQKALTLRAIVDGRAPLVRTEWALVTGHVAPEGAEFVTIPTTEIPLFILRDPPGDGSYAYIEEGTTGCVRLDWSNWMLSAGIGPQFELKLGATQKVWVGVGGGIIDEVTAHTQTDGKLLFGGKISSERTMDFCVTTTERLATSSDDDFVGADADLYVGLGISFLFSEVGVIELNDCVVGQSTSVAFEPDSIHTTYAFTQRHITDTLIPELDSKVAYFNAHDNPDSSRIFEMFRDQWQYQVDYNRADKVSRVDTLAVEEIGGLSLPPETVPRNVENRSWSAGTEYEFSKEQTQNRVYNFQTTGYVKGEGKVLFNIGLKSKAEFLLGVAVETDNEFLLPRLSQHSDTTTTWKTGYVLTDGDSGDNFTVDIVETQKWGYIFDVLGGRSSCPYEPWFDLESGGASMVRRDQPQLLINPTERFAVDPEALATFKLTIANLSDEQRAYVVKALSNSNPGGAIMRLNGAPITDEPVFVIDGLGQGINSHEATLSVERGPTRFNYERLALVVEPVCGPDVFGENGELATVDSIFFNVSFEGCSEIAMHGPDIEPGWVYNRADSIAGKQLDVVLDGYELIVNPKTPNVVEAVGIQYRYMGVDRQGPGPWVDIKEIPPGIDADISADGSPDTIMVWQPDSLDNGAYLPLVDGIYELRAYTVCSAGGRGYSDVSTGTIDRNAPRVFGTPQPADGEFSLGESIRITFNEPLDCAALGDATITLKYIDGPHAGEMIGVTPVCNGESIVLVPQTPAANLDGWRLEASVGGVTDRVGNTTTSTATWQFDYRQSLFTWSQTRISQSAALVTPGSVDAELVNGTDAAVDYEITSVPAFLGVAPSLASGRLAPGARRDIPFDIDPAITGGIHEGTVVVQAVNLAGDDTVAVATMDVVLDVSCAPPAWTIDPARYEYSMSIVARVLTDDGMLTDANDRLAAFVGNELRGLAVPQDVAGDTLVFLTVFSDRPSGELVRFEVWDDDQCHRYRSTDDNAPFLAEDVLGTTLAPMVLTALDAPPASVASFPVVAGWNWFSTHMVSVDMSVSGVLASLTPRAGDIIKSKTAFAVFDPDSLIGWVGSLTTLDNTSGYMLRLGEPGTILQEGTPADPATTAVPVDNGWNWIGYLPAGEHAVGDALADLETLGLLNGDEIVKGQSAFAEWNAGWFGNLTTMRPGEAYRLYLADPALPSAFNYPSAVLVAATRGATGAARSSPSGAGPPWRVDDGRFEYNMNVIASIDYHNTSWMSADDVVGAFVGDECRGVGTFVSIPGIETPLAFLTVQSAVADGETVSFRAYDTGAETEYAVSETIAFVADGVRGGIRDPLRLTPGGSASGGTPTAFRLAQNHPNPFNPVTTIRYELPSARHVTIRIYNVAGQMIRTLVDRDMEPGAHDVEWDGRTSSGSGAASGVYFYRMQAGAFTDVKKMVLLQ